MLYRNARIALAALALGAGHAAAETPTERGQYLVETIAGCGNCHTPRGPGGVFAADKHMAGGFVIDEKPFRAVTSNITPDKETGIGNWTDAQIKTLLLTGKNPHGIQEAEVMPTAFYPILTPGDLDGIVAYLRSLTPVKNKVADPVYKIALPHHVFPGAEKAYTQADLNDKLKRGFYLATIGHCMECHARRPDGTQDFKNWWGKGGNVMKGPFGAVAVSNITSHPKSGIGAWSDAEIKRALTQGLSRDGRAFKPPMARQMFFSKMTEADLNALVAWLRTLPPLE